MFGADKGKAGKLDGNGLYIGVVQARWNEAITGARVRLFSAIGALDQSYVGL